MLPMLHADPVEDFHPGYHRGFHPVPKMTKVLDSGS